MKPISPRPILTLSILTAANQKASQIPHVLSFSTQSGHHQWRRQEEESRAVRVSVWWDFENCHVPVNGNAFRVAQCITNAIRANGIRGPIEITAFGDVMQISRTNQEALSATGINLTHVPSGGKNSADRSLLVDLMYWVSKNPPPAHLLLISGDRDFAGVLHRLRMSNYNILLASPDSAPNVLCSAATIMWQWSSLLKGENLTGKLFNQPPDGPYNSWYGHYKAPLVDPFAVTEQSSCSSADQSSLVASEPKLLASEVKLRPIPKSLMKHIYHILRSHPEGILISQLRAELSKCDVDKELYGYKKFSRFLLAMPHILELYGDEGRIKAKRVNTKFSDELSPAASDELSNGEFQVCSDTKTDIEKFSFEDVSEKSTIDPVSDSKVKAAFTNLQETPKIKKQDEHSESMKMQDVKMEAHASNLQDLNKEKNLKPSLPQNNTQEMQEIPKVENQDDSSVSMKMEDVKMKTRASNLQDLKKETNQKASLPQPNKDEAASASSAVEMKDLSEKNEDRTLVVDDRSSASEFGIFRRTWVKLFGSRDARLDEALSETDAKHSEALGEKVPVTQKTAAPCQSPEFFSPALFSPSSHEALINGMVSQSDDAASSNRSWSSSKSEDKVETSGETADHPQVNVKLVDEKREEKNNEAGRVDAKPQHHEVFAKESFWKEMESFITSTQGSTICTRSKTREFLAQALQKQGPVALRSLAITDLRHLVNILISEKKWVEERNFGRYPFRVTHSAGKSQQSNHPLGSNGLSQFFSERQKHQSHPHTGVPQSIVHRDSSSKPKSEIMADCQKLVDQIVKDYPEGFNVGGFRKLFVEKYGYALDLQKLGHDKLASFLKIIPGVVLESNLILPGPVKNLPIQDTKVGPSDDDSSIITNKDDEFDSWDELGPVESSAGSEKDESEARAAGKSRKGTEQRLQYYEPLREDDFSDSDDDSSPYTRSEDENKPKVLPESALLNILDSWHGQKEITGTDPGTTKKESELPKSTHRPKSQKSYSFVKEAPSGDGKDKLIDGILGSLQKSRDKSADSHIIS